MQFCLEVGCRKEEERRTFILFLLPRAKPELPKFHLGISQIVGSPHKSCFPSDAASLVQCTTLHEEHLFLSLCPSSHT